MITLVYAQDKNGGIGYQNDLPWHLPNDLKFFKRVTMGHTMVMGRRTFESMGCRLLPGRETVVVTRDVNYGRDIEGLICLHSIEDVLELSKDKSLKVIGGAQLFLDVLPHADEIIRTVIDAEFPADTFMPDIDENQWTLVQVENGTTDEANIYPHQYQWWKRK